MDLGEGESGLNTEIIHYKRNLNDTHTMLISPPLLYHPLLILQNKKIIIALFCYLKYK